jgi:hypothetical protein
MPTLGRGFLQAATAVITCGALMACAGAAGSSGHEASGGSWRNAQPLPGLATLNARGAASVAQVSCSSPGNCAAGGYYLDRTRGRQPFVVSERDGRWARAIEVPGTAALTGSRSSQITSVSCAAAGFCGADGEYTDRAGQTAPFLVTERAGRWGRAMNVPGLAALNLGRDGADVSSISCPSAGNCLTGGYYSSRVEGLRGFVVGQKRGRWGRARTVSGAADITAASCSSAGNCTVAGAAPPAQVLPIAATETDGHWGSVVRIPVPAALSDFSVSINSMSCPGQGSCAAGGFLLNNTTDSANTQAFVVSEAGGQWGPVQEEIVPGTTTVTLEQYAATESVSCASPGNCAAGGEYNDSANRSEGFVMTEVAGQWEQPMQPPGMAKLGPGGYGEVASVSCPAAGYCTAAGHFASHRHFQGFVVGAAGGQWGQVMAVPGLMKLNAGGLAEVAAVSCPSVGHCSAVGEYASRPIDSQVFVVKEN